MSLSEIKHDSDGKLYFEEDGAVNLVAEVPIEQGDAVAGAMNLYSGKVVSKLARMEGHCEGLLKLLRLKNKFTGLLQRELAATGMIAVLHGWESESGEEGVRLRKEIKELTEELSKI